jgi:hypothetical protein
MQRSEGQVFGKDKNSRKTRNDQILLPNLSLIQVQLSFIISRLLIYKLLIGNYLFSEFYVQKLLILKT